MGMHFTTQAKAGLTARRSAQVRMCLSTDACASAEKLTISASTGDVIGIIFNRAEKTVAYTKNGMYLGVAFQNVCEERLYPTVGQPVNSLMCLCLPTTDRESLSGLQVGMRTPEEEVRWPPDSTQGAQPCYDPGEPVS